MRSGECRLLLVCGLFAGSILLAGCAADPIGARFRAEKDFVAAERLRESVKIGQAGPVAAPDLDRCVAAYEAVLSRNPIPQDPSRDTTLTYAIGRIRAQAQIRVAQIMVQKGDSAGVRRTLEAGCEAYPWDLGISLGFKTELSKYQLGTLNFDAAIRTLRELQSRYPARLTGRPVVPVQDAPLQVSDILRGNGRVAEADGELQRAESYYREVIAADPNDEAAAYATIQMCKIAMRRGRYDEATRILEQVRRSPSAGEWQPLILYLLGMNRQEGEKNPTAAIPVFDEMVKRFPQDPQACDAMMRKGACLADCGRIDEAVETLSQVEVVFPAKVENVLRARVMAAHILAGSGRWGEALSRYRAIEADYPMSQEALSVPLEVAAHYRATGDTETANITLRRAIERYDELVKGNPGSFAARAADEAAVQALFEMKRWDEAAKRLLSFPAAYPGHPQNPSAMLDAAAVYKDQLGDNAKAADVLQTIALNYPDSPLAQRASEEARRIRGQ
jgi:TolA-binding protein